MTDSNYNVDASLRAEFIDESDEALGSLDNLFVQLEAEPANLELIGSIFRPIHTVKGNSAFFGLMKVKILSHEMETLLDLARKGLLVPSPTIISVLLTGVDQLKAMMLRAREDQPEIDDEAAFDALVQQVIACKESDTDGAIWEQLFETLDTLRPLITPPEAEAAKTFDTLVGLIDDLAPKDEPDESTEPSIGPHTELIEKIMPLLEKAAGSPLSDDESHLVRDSWTALKEAVEGAAASELIESALDDYATMTAAVGFDSLLADLLSEKITALTAMAPWKETAPAADETPEATAAPIAAKKSTASKPKSDTGKTMRIPEDSIDNFLSFVGELIVVGEMFGHLQKRLTSQSTDHRTTAEFRQVNDTFTELSTNLRKSIMEIRKVTVRAVLQKVPRMVRDIATHTGKQITVTLEGEDTHIDKSLLDTLEAPLTHMVRNSADHGIEMPDDREAAGKPREGTVRVAVKETENEIILTVSDDGKGLDYDAIRAKAVSIGLIAENQDMTEDDVVDLLFASGVSTATEVTDVSGRGVGMDVVKRNVESAGGKITVESSPGKGSVFTIMVPKSVSTQIMEGFIIRYGSTCYVLPLDRIRESFRPTPEELSSVIDKGECVMRHGNLLPVISLAEIFEEVERETDKEDSDGLMIALDSGKRRVALHVHEVLGVQQVVVKPMEGLIADTNIVEGGAIMGDGTVAVVLDADNLTKSRLLLT